MLVGCYYRCPIVVEEGDRDHPRFYILAQLVEYNEIADAVKVEMHDLLGSRQYYGDLFQHNVFFAQAAVSYTHLQMKLQIKWRKNSRHTSGIATW